MEAMKKGGKVKQKQKQKQKQQQTVNVYVGRPRAQKQVRKPPPSFMSFAMQDPGFIRLLNPQQPGQPQALQPQVRHPALFQPGPPQPLFQPQPAEPSQPTPTPSLPTPIQLPEMKMIMSALKDSVGYDEPAQPAQPAPAPISFSIPGQPQKLKKRIIGYVSPAQPASPTLSSISSISQPGIPLSISQLPALKDSVASPIVSQEEGYEGKEVEEEPMLSASDAGPSRTTYDLARSLYVEPNPLSPEFKIPASVPAVKRKPSGGKLGWTQYYQTVKGGFDRAKAIFGSRDKDDPSVKQFFGMVYKQYEKYLDS